jgi:hypothetical protein
MLDPTLNAIAVEIERVHQEIENGTLSWVDKYELKADLGRLTDRYAALTITDQQPTDQQPGANNKAPRLFKHPAPKLPQFFIELQGSAVRPTLKLPQFLVQPHI